MTDDRGPSSMRWVPGPTEHLAHIIEPAIERFADEDGCSPEVWMCRAIRAIAIERLNGEAGYDGYDTLSAERRPRKGS